MRFFWRRDLHALAGAYALDALDGAERDRFERHLRGCRACQSEVRGFAATAAALAMAAAAEPPPGLKQRVLAAAAVTRQSPPEVGKVAARRRPRTTTPRRAWLPRLALSAAAAGLVAAAVLGGITVWTQHQLTTAQAENQAIAAVLAAPDAQFTTARTSAGGIATVVASHSAGKMVFTSVGLHALPPSQVSELWVLRAGSARPAGLVPSAIAGRTPPVLASGLAVGDKIGVTVEPAGGSSSPTTTPIVVLTLSA